jgi:hypothetical protein
MNPLSKASSNALAASLFLKNGNKDWCTWGLLGRDQIPYINAVISKQRQYGSQVFTAMIWNMVDPKNAVENPFIGNPSASTVIKRVFSMQDPGWDGLEIFRWGQVLTEAMKTMYFVPTIFCGDDRASTRNVAFVDWFTPIIIRGLYPLVVGYNLISEASKSWNRDEINHVASVAKAAFEIEPKLAPKPILVHQQGTDIGDVADGLMYEFSKDPNKANEFSLSDVEREAAGVLARYKKWVWFQELAVRCEEPWAREMARKIRDMSVTEPRIVGLPGPC